MESLTSLNNVRIHDSGIEVSDFKFIRGSIIDELLFDNNLMTTTQKFDKFANAKTIEDRFGEIVKHTFCKLLLTGRDRVGCFYIERKDFSREIVEGKIITVPGLKTIIVKVPILYNSKHASDFTFTIRDYNEEKMLNSDPLSLIKIEKVAEWSDPYEIAFKYIDTNYKAFGIEVQLSSFNVKESELSKSVKSLLNSIRK